MYKSSCLFSWCIIQKYSTIAAKYFGIREYTTTKLKSQNNCIVDAEKESPSPTNGIRKSLRSGSSATDFPPTNKQPRYRLCEQSEFIAPRRSLLCSPCFKAPPQQPMRTSEKQRNAFASPAPQPAVRDHFPRSVGLHTSPPQPH